MPKQTITRIEEIKPVISLASGQQLPLSRPLVIGVLNVTPDSFSDGGHYIFTKEAIKRALTMEQEGADIIDIGGESSRPGAKPISADEEIKRVIPVIEGVRRVSSVPISIDTYKASTAKVALEAGADIVNDISALRFDMKMVEVLSKTKAPVILMHMLGTPQNMQLNPHYENCVNEIYSFFKERIAYCLNNGIDKAKIIIDPGIGFGKRLSDNIEIISRLSELLSLERPILIGTSRKSFIHMLHPADYPAEKRIGGSLASMVMGILNGAKLVRVHDVAETVEALKIIWALKGN